MRDTVLLLSYFCSGSLCLALGALASVYFCASVIIPCILCGLYFCAFTLINFEWLQKFAD